MSILSISSRRNEAAVADVFPDALVLHSSSLVINVDYTHDKWQPDPFLVNDQS